MPVRAVTRAAIFASVLCAAAAVSVTGPIAFIGLVVPHIVRPLVGDRFAVSLPANAMAGAIVALLADLVARTAMLPFVLHTSVVTELLGGIVFVWIVRRHYLRHGARA